MWRGAKHNGRGVGRRSASALCVLALLAKSNLVQAAEPAPLVPPKTSLEAPQNRPLTGLDERPATDPPARGPSAAEDDGFLPLGTHTLVEVGAALIALPFAELCPAEGAACTPAETSVGFSANVLGRWRDFGFGGGFMWAFGLRPTNVAGADSLERAHSRNYLTIEAVFRYYLPPLKNWDWWLGANAGGIIVNDSFTTLADREPYADTAFVGPRALTLRTEGATVSLGIGGHWRFSDQFVFGTHLRYANWLLPEERERTPLGDVASLAGRIDVIDVGVMLGALLPL